MGTTKRKRSYNNKKKQKHITSEQKRRHYKLMRRTITNACRTTVCVELVHKQTAKQRDTDTERKW